MFCSNCGAKVPDDAAFCTSCGTKMNGEQIVDQKVEEVMADATLGSDLESMDSAEETVTGSYSAAVTQEEVALAAEAPVVKEVTTPKQAPVQPQPVPEPRVAPTPPPAPEPRVAPTPPPQPQPAPQPMQQQTAQVIDVTDKPMTVLGWLGTFLLLFIPIVNIILPFVWAFSSGTNKSKRSYFQAYLIMAAILIVLGIVFGSALAVFFGAMMESGTYY